MTHAITISPLPSALFDFLQDSGLTQAGMSFNNCFLAVMNTLRNRNFNLNYCLAWVTHSGDGIRTQHALLRSGKYFYDPTLQPQGLHLTCTYELEREFLQEELIQLIGHRFELRHLEQMITGEEPWWPLVKTENGFGFVHAPKPTRF